MTAMLGGAGAVSMPMLNAASDYTTIRALGYPAAILTMTLQSAFISTKDSKTPLLAVPIAAAVNLAADIILVPGMGAAGAAWATTLALYTNAAALLAMWSRKIRTFAGSGKKALLAWPSQLEAKQMLAFAAPMMVALIARVALGFSITLSAVALGTTALAANQVIESLYWLFCPFGEAISLCMQAYLPPLLLKGRSLARRLQTTAFRAAGGLGLLAAGGACVLPIFKPGLFTSSAAVALTCRQAAPMLGFALFSYVFACAMEGMLIARRQLRFLAVAHISNTVALSVALASLARRPGATLAHLWVVFGMCNILRMAEFSIGLRREDIATVVERKEESSRWRRALRSLRGRSARMANVAMRALH